MNNKPDFPYPGLRPFREDEFQIFFGRDEQIVQLAIQFTDKKQDFVALTTRLHSDKVLFLQTGLLSDLEGCNKKDWDISKLFENFEGDEFQIFFGGDKQIAQLATKFIDKKQDFIALATRLYNDKSLLLQKGLLNDLKSHNKKNWDIFAPPATLLTNLIDEHFIAVVGRSGSGKSSLVRTGLLNALQDYTDKNWEKTIELSPTELPLASLTKTLLKNNTFSKNYADIKNNPPEDNLPNLLLSDLYNGTWNIIQEVLNHDKKNTHFLIFIDQFEELFSYTKEKDSSQLRIFIQLIFNIIKQPNIYVIITMRSDFLDDCTQFYGLPELIDKALFIVPRLTEEQLKESIEAPARLLGDKVDPELTEWLIDEMKDNINDQLPLMQHALRTIWWYVRTTGRPQTFEENGKEKTSYVLTLADYEKVGKKSLTKTLSYQADEAFNSLSEQQKMIAERMFRCLIDVSSNRQDIRRPMQLQQLVELINVDKDELVKIINVFRGKGREYLTPSLYESHNYQDRELKSEETIKIVHESFIRSWERLKEWQKAEEEAFKIYQGLKRAAKTWKQENKKSRYLWSFNHELIEAEEWHKSPQAEHSWAKLYDKDDDKNENYDLIIDFYHKSQYKKFFLQWGGIGFAVLIALGILSYYWHEEKQRTITLFSSLVQNAGVYSQTQHYANAQQQLSESYQYDDKLSTSKHQARNFLAQFNTIKLNHQPSREIPVLEQLSSIVINPDKQVVAFMGKSNTFYTFDTIGFNEHRPFETSFKETATFPLLAFSPTNEYLIIAADASGEEIEIRDTADFQLLSKAQINMNSLSAMDISPNGELLAIGDVKTITETDNTKRVIGNIKVFEYQNNALTLVFETKYQGRVNDIKFKDDHNLAVANEANVDMWDLTQKQTLNQLTASDKIYTLAFSPDKQLLATAGQDQQVIVWESNTFKQLYSLRGHQDRILDIAFRNNNQLISASADKTLRLWDLKSRTMLKMFAGHNAQVTSFAIDQQNLFSISTDGKVLKWDIDLSKQPIIQTSNEPTAVAITPNAQQLAVGFDDGTIGWYDLQQQQFLQPNVKAHNEIISRLMVSSDNQLLASGSIDNTVKVWDVTETQLTEIDVIQHEGDISAIAFSPNNQLLASASYDGKIGLWQAASKNLEFTKNAHSAGSEINSIEFSQDGQFLLSAADRDVKLWQVKNNGILQPEKSIFTPQNMQIFWATLSPDNQKVAIVGKDPHLVIVKDLKTNEELLFFSHKNSILKAIFAPNGKQLLTASGDATVRVWNLADNLADSHELFPIYLPVKLPPPAPLWDFDFRCAEQGKGHCWLAVPLTNNRLVLYDFGKIYH